MLSNMVTRLSFLICWLVLANSATGHDDPPPSPPENPNKLPVVIPHVNEFDTAALNSLNDLGRICDVVTKRVESTLDFAARNQVYLLDTELLLLQNAFHGCRSFMDTYEYYNYQISYREGQNPQIPVQSQHGPGGQRSSNSN